MQGASPLASPGLNGTRHWLSLRCRKPKGGAAILVACLHCHCGTQRGAQGGSRLLTLPLACFYAPIPPTPFPSGEGGDLRLFYARGGAPCIPGAVPGRHWRNYGQPFAFALAANRRLPDVGHLYGCLCKCRKRLGAGVPGAVAPGKTNFGAPPSPEGKGVGGMGAKKQIKGKAGGQQRRQTPIAFSTAAGTAGTAGGGAPPAPPLPSFPFPQQSPHKENHAVDERREENRQNNMRENTEPEKADRRNSTRRESRRKHAE